MSSSVNKIQFNVKLQFNDLLRYGYKHYFSKIQGKLVTLLTIFAVMIYFMEIALYYEEMGSNFFIAYLPTLFLVIFPIVIPPLEIFLKCKLMFSSDNFFQEEQYYIFSEDGFSVKTISYGKDVRWNEICKVVCDKHNIVIHVSKNKYFIIPKRILERTEQCLATLEQLIKTSVPKKKLKMK